MQRDRFMWQLGYMALSSMALLFPLLCCSTSIKPVDGVEETVSDPKRKFVHVVIFGRGLAFRDYWSMHGERNTNKDIRLFLLHAPQLKTTGDLMVSSWSYHTWRYGLKWAPEGGEPETMPLREYGERRVNGGGRQTIRWRFAQRMDHADSLDDTEEIRHGEP